MTTIAFEYKREVLAKVKDMGARHAYYTELTADIILEVLNKDGFDEFELPSGTKGTQIIERLHKTQTDLRSHPDRKPNKTPGLDEKKSLMEIYAKSTLRTELNQFLISQLKVNTLSNQKFFKPTKSYILYDQQGNNSVQSIIAYYENGIRVGYQFNGLNNSNEQRNIIVYDNGGALNAFNKSSDLGIVGKQMFDQRSSIFEHFGIEDPSLNYQNRM